MSQCGRTKIDNSDPFKFLIEAINDELIITATDLTVGVRCFTEVKILEEGATTLPAKRFAQLIRELTSVNVEISSNDNEVTEIIANTSRFKLNGMNKMNFRRCQILQTRRILKLNRVS